MDVGLDTLGGGGMGCRDTGIGEGMRKRGREAGHRGARE